VKLINYPAMASPASIEIIGKNISGRLKSGSRIIDPFCGTGRLLFNPRELGHNVTGVDCSPVALLTARVCHQANDSKKIMKNLSGILNSFDRCQGEFLASESDKFWFSDNTYSDLRKLLSCIDSYSVSKNTNRFFWLALVDSIRSASYIREEEYKTHRMKLEKRQSFKPNVRTIFFDVCKKMLSRIEKASKLKPGGYRLIHGDVVKTKISGGKFDALITSPPYGDSASTVGYGQFARIPLFILSYSQSFSLEFNLELNSGSLDSLCLGGVRCSTPKEVELPGMVNYISKGPMRKFCTDYFYRLKKVSGYLNDEALCCFVLADRTYQGVRFPLIESTIDFMGGLGFTLLSQDDRYLSHKRLPRTMQYINKSKAATHTGMNYESVLTFSR
jgi:tRNA G10  N-methylase Trm11